MKTIYSIRTPAWFITGVFFCLLISPSVFAQEASDIDARLQAVEAYVANLEPAMNKFSADITNQMTSYAQSLGTNLDQFAMGLQENLDRRLVLLDTRTVYLNPAATDYQRIDTNSGTLLVGIQNVSKIDGGFRLTLNIGNINNADFQDFKIRLQWGGKWNEGAVSYNDWRASLQGAEYTFNGTLKKGAWSNVDVDLVPAQQAQFSHIECQINVGAVDLVQPE